MFHTHSELFNYPDELKEHLLGPEHKCIGIELIPADENDDNSFALADSLHKSLHRRWYDASYTVYTELFKEFDALKSHIDEIYQHQNHVREQTERRTLAEQARQCVVQLNIIADVFDHMQPLDPEV